MRPQIDRFSLRPQVESLGKPKSRQGEPLKPIKPLKTSNFCTDHPLRISTGQCILTSWSPELPQQASVENVIWGKIPELAERVRLIKTELEAKG